MTKSTDRPRSSSVQVSYKRRQGPGSRQAKPARKTTTTATNMVVPAKPGFGLFGNSRRIQEALEQMQADMDAISQGKLPNIPDSAAPSADSSGAD